MRLNNPNNDNPNNDNLNVNLLSEILLDLDHSPRYFWAGL